MKEIKRISAGVMFESDVLAFIDQLAAAQQRNRSFIINSIVRHYARMMQLPINVIEAEPSQPKSAVPAEKAINF